MEQSMNLCSHAKSSCSSLAGPGRCGGLWNKAMASEHVRSTCSFHDHNESTLELEYCYSMVGIDCQCPPPHIRQLPRRSPTNEVVQLQSLQSRPSRSFVTPMIFAIAATVPPMLPSVEASYHDSCGPIVRSVTTVLEIPQQKRQTPRSPTAVVARIRKWIFFLATHHFDSIPTGFGVPSLG